LKSQNQDIIVWLLLFSLVLPVWLLAFADPAHIPEAIDLTKYLIPMVISELGRNLKSNEK
jgi:hypothetical protein